MKFSTICKTLAFFVLAAAVSVSAFAFTGGSGTADDPYQVATLADLEQVRDYPSSHFKQTKDIIINNPSMFEFDDDGTLVGVAEGVEPEVWEPIEGFTGTYNGNKKYITGLYVTDDYANGGLFADINGGSVTNVYLEYALVESDEYAGILAAKIDGAASVSGCMTAGSVIGMTTKEMNIAGGLAGYVGAEAAVATSISHATVTGATSYSAYVGGLVGLNHGTLTGCGFGGSVYGTATYYDALIGGIAGYNTGSISNCRSAGTVGGESTAMVNDCYVGGIAGMNKGSLANCYNDSAVSVVNINLSADSVCAAGGIAGITVDADITECTNNGEIASPEGVDVYSYYGGIAGIAVSDSDAHYISNCDNMGTVYASYSVAGGIVGRAVAAGEGYVSTKLIVEECYNSGDVDGNIKGEIAGETGTVESASVTIGDELSAANDNECSAYAIYKIVADGVQYASGIRGTTYTIFNGTETISKAPSRVLVGDLYSFRLSGDDASYFAVKPVLVKLIIVSDATQVEALSVNIDGLSFADGSISGNVLVEVYRPENDVTEYIVVVGTSFGEDIESEIRIFAAADFGTVTGSDRITTVTVPVDCTVAEGRTVGLIDVSAFVVETTESMKPLCEKTTASK